VTSLEAALRQIHTDLTEAHVSFALVGGLAVSARTEPRFTRDADLAVAPASDAAAETLIHSLAPAATASKPWWNTKLSGRLATVRLTRSTTLQAPVIDLLFASSGIEPEVVGEAEPIELLPTLTIGVARTGHLIALKVLSRDDPRRISSLELASLMPASWNHIAGWLRQIDAIRQGHLSGCRPLPKAVQ
jgi:hypothetical protein